MQELCLIWEQTVGLRTLSNRILWVVLLLKLAYSGLITVLVHIRSCLILRVESSQVVLRVVIPLLHLITLHSDHAMWLLLGCHLLLVQSLVVWSTLLTMWSYTTTMRLIVTLMRKVVWWGAPFHSILLSLQVLCSMRKRLLSSCSIHARLSPLVGRKSSLRLRCVVLSVLGKPHSWKRW